MQFGMFERLQTIVFRSTEFKVELI